jgi:hypothetical protein
MKKWSLLRRTQTVFCALLCLTLVYAARVAPQTASAAERPNFSGTWRLNRELSDKPQEKLKEAVGQQGGMRGRIMGGRMAQGRMKDRAAMAEVLKITHNDPELQVSGNNNRSVQLFTDGRKLNTTTPRGESAETTARWQGAQLVVVSQTAKGGKLTQTYSLEQGGAQMIVLMKISDQRLGQPIELRFIYDASE